MNAPVRERNNSINTRMSSCRYRCRLDFFFPPLASRRMPLRGIACACNPGVLPWLEKNKASHPIQLRQPPTPHAAYTTKREKHNNHQNRGSDAAKEERVDGARR